MSTNLKNKSSISIVFLMSYSCLSEEKIPTSNVTLAAAPAKFILYETGSGWSCFRWTQTFLGYSKTEGPEQKD